MSSLDELKQSISEIRSSPTNVDLYLRRGIACYEFGCYDECASDLMFYESYGGGDPQFMKYLGMALKKTTSSRSVEYLRRYLSAVPDDIDAVVYLAEVYFESGDYTSSASMYKVAVECGYNPGVLREKASMLSGMKMYDEAVLFDPAYGKKSFFRR